MLLKFFWVVRAIAYRAFFKKIGRFSYIGKPIYLFGVDRIAIGQRVRIFPQCRMEAHGVNSSITIEDNCSIGQNFHIISSGELIIQKNSLISFDVMITDTDHQYLSINVPVIDQGLITKRTNIGENCFIGCGVKILAGTTLGRQCIIGANAVVRGSFPDYCVIVGAPSKVVRRFNLVTNTWEKTNDKGEFLDEV